MDNQQQLIIWVINNVTYMTPGSRNEPLCHTYVTHDSEC